MTARRPDHGGISVLLAAAGALILLAAVLAAAGAVSITAAACQSPVPASAAAAGIPAAYLASYQAAGIAYGIPWTILAGIGKVETDHGRSRAPGVHSGANPAGAAGPMQIGIGGRAGNTWGGAPVHPASERTGGYGTDGDHDGVADVYDPGDAIPAAAAYLHARGARGDIRAALLAYNHSAAYVSDVLGRAARYGAGSADARAGLACQAARLGPLPPGAAGKILAYAEAQLGRPYQWGAAGPAAFDCSGLTMQAYRAAGIAIPRTSQQQWAAGPRVPASRVRPGDLVFFAGSDGTLTAPGHVGIVTRPGMMIDAPFTGQVVREESYGSIPGLVGFTRP